MSRVVENLRANSHRVGVAIGAAVSVLGLVALVALVVTDPVSRSPDEAVDFDQSEARVPTSAATADAFPEPGATLTTLLQVPGPDRTIRAYSTVTNGQTQIVRETVNETAPGVRITAVRMRTETARVTVTTTVTNDVPGPTQTIIETTTVTETVTPPAP